MISKNESKRIEHEDVASHGTAGILALLAGCIPSLHPIDTGKDLSFDPALLGAWSDGETTLTFAKKGKEDTRCAGKKGG